MLRGVLLASLLGLILIDAGYGQSSDVHYSIVAPKAFRPSSTYSLTATCYNVAEDVDLTLRIQASDNKTLVEKEIVLKSGDTQIVSLWIPPDVLETNYYLVAEGSGGFKIFASHSVSVLRKTLSIFVQTDKAMYKPGQTVLFRAIAVYPDLKPYQGFMDIVIHDLAGNRIMQWLDQKNESGVITQSLKLSDQTPLGKWKIDVTALENSFTKMFEVDEYVLPKFKVAVHLPSYYLVNANRKDVQEDLPVTVLAEYTYGQPVKGRANVAIQLKPYSAWDKTNYTKVTKDVQLVEGKADLILTIKELLSLLPATYYRDSTYTPDMWAMLASRTILVTASVNETVTGIILSGNATVGCSSAKYKLEFLEFSPNNYKPGLLYTAFMQLSQPDGKPPVSSDIVLPKDGYRTVNVKVTTNYPGKYDRNGTWMYTPSTTKFLNVTVTPSGYMTLSLMMDTNATSVNLEPSFFVVETNSTVYSYKYITIFKSRDNLAIRVSYDSQDGVIRPLETATFKVTATEPITTFEYQVLGKGSILLSGNVVGDESTEHTFSIWISNDMALKLAPRAHFIVSFITNSGEIIADSTELTVSDYFANKVSCAFDRNSTTPSQNVTLTVSAYPESYVGLLAVDQSVLLLKGGNDITQEMVSSELNSYESSVGYYPYPRFVEDRRRKRSIWWPRSISGSDTLTILSNVGLFMLTDAYLHQSRTDYYPSAGGRVGIAGPAGPNDDGRVESAPPTGGNNPDTKDDSSKPRVDFPETWIWTDAVAGSDGRVTFDTSVPDTITSWILSAFAVSPVAGLGVAENQAELAVFKQFFVSPNLPYSVIRGEEFALKCTVFNYMPQTLDVQVTLQQSTHYKIQGSASQLVQVESNDAVSVYFWTLPLSEGQIPIDISAQSPVAGDSMRLTLLVKPEGVQQQYSTSAFMQLSHSVPTYNNTLNVSLPPVGKLVPGSQYIEVTAIGDLMGPSIQGLENLLQMPSGCGEQNMLNFAPDVCIANYLNISGQLTSELKNKAFGFMNTGYQRELTYQRSDGSFSAFGNNDLSGSVWLSSFVILSFQEAKVFIPVEDGKIAQTMRWIISNQAKNGSFAEPPNGKVVHVDMQGGSSKGLPLTAYVLNSLIENRNNSHIDSLYVETSILAARIYLEGQLFSVTSDPYALCILAYALVRSNSSKVTDVLQKLEALAIVEAGTKHWEKASDTSDAPQFGWRPPYQQARSVNIEMTSYVLLTYCHLKNFSMSLPIAKWIIAQRNANGGFSSTQDTVMALKAMTEFASLLLGPSDERNLQISIATDSVQHNFVPITSETSILLQSYELPSNTKQVFVTASGRGSALIQLNVKYNVYKTDDISAISLNVSSAQDGDKLTVKSCSSWEKKEGSGMVVMEINQLTGFEASNVDDLKNQANGLIKRVETKDGKVVLYLDELTSNETCVDVISEKIFPVSNVKDAPVKVYPYYDPSGARTSFYAAPQTLGQNSPCAECPQCCSTSGKARKTPAPRPRTTKPPISAAPRRSTPLRKDQKPK